MNPIDVFAIFIVVLTLSFIFIPLLGKCISHAEGYEESLNAGWTVIVTIILVIMTITLVIVVVQSFVHVIRLLFG